MQCTDVRIVRPEVKAELLDRTSCGLADWELADFPSALERGHGICFEVTGRFFVQPGPELCDVGRQGLWPLV